MTQPTLSTQWATVQSVIETAAGIPMLWKFQPYNQPATDYGVISLGAYTTVGIDYVQETVTAEWAALTPYAVADRALNNGEKTYVCTIAGTSAGSGGPTGTGSAIVDGGVTWAYVAPGSEVALTVGGVREVPLQLQVYSAAIIEQVAQATALATCDAIVTRLRLPTARTALAAVGLTPFDPGASNWVPSIVATTFRGRATCDIRCRVPARMLAEYTSFIASVSLVATIGASGGTVTETITA